jgi:hypothetical protein
MMEVSQVEQGQLYSDNREQQAESSGLKSGQQAPIQTDTCGLFLILCKYTMNDNGTMLLLGLETILNFVGTAGMIVTNLWIGLYG